MTGSLPAWGALALPSGGARFRIWAPAEQSMTVEVDDVAHAMARDGDGWFECEVATARPGSRYMFVLADDMRVPDPASRAQAGDVHGPSIVTADDHDWRNPQWQGRPWPESVIYELHVGTFTEEGTFAGAAARLPHLARLGVTAIEIMPVAQFAGNRGWGYDGVLPYAPHPAYGSPDDMRAFIDEAHGHGLMVLLDVVHNHFGPEGNYLHRYAPQFFHADRTTPWGPAIDYGREPVRRFFIDNALYWLQSFRLDGLRFDAIDNIRDESTPELMVEMAQEIRRALPGRHIHLTTEDNRNVTHLHERAADGTAALHTGEWNDDFHNAAHVALTGESEGYYEDFAADPWGLLGRSLAEGFAYQGEHAPHSGTMRGVPSGHMPPDAFVDFLQNHDQVGNRALGERLATLAAPRALELMTAVLLLSPHIPLMFMGDEFGEMRPFLFFTDFQGELADAVREGRRREFAGFSGFAGAVEVPDPNAHATFAASRLDWERAASPDGAERTEATRRLLALRHAQIVPLLSQAGTHASRVRMAADGVLAVDWRLGEDELCMRANLSEKACDIAAADGRIVHADPPSAARHVTEGRLPPESLVVAVRQGTGTRNA